MTTLRIAFRNLSRQKKRSFLLGGAIAFGILIIMLVNAFAAGFVENVQENFSQFLAGHVFLQGFEKSPSGKLIGVIRDDSRLLQAIRNTPGLQPRSISKRSSLQGNLIFEGQNIQQEITGVDWNEEALLAERMVLRAGSMAAFLADPRGLILNEKMAAQLGVAIGESVLVLARTVTGQQNVGELVLRATTVDAGLLSTVSAYAHRGYVNELLNIAPGQYVYLGIYLENLISVDRQAPALYQALAASLPMFPRISGGPRGFQEQQRQMLEESWEGTKYRFITIKDYLQGLEQVATALNTVGLVVVLILFVIIMVGITNTFRMIVYERTREIGAMRALGLQRGGIRGLFLLEALLLSLGGVVVGLAAAALVAAGLSFAHWDPSAPIYMFLRNGHLSFKVVPLQLVGYLLLVALITLLAALLPALRAARLEPAKALGKAY
jgi:putative ABC transport system permease protein